MLSKSYQRILGVTFVWVLLGWNNLFYLLEAETPFGFCKIVHPGTIPTNSCTPCLVSRDTQPLDPKYSVDFWATVDIAPVPLFFINTHDPKHQDIYISAAAHANTEPWDKYIWNLILSAHQERKSLIVDVGANIGYFSLMAASLGHQVIAFEPMSRNAAKLQSSILRNQFENKITLYQNAVASLANVQVTLKETHYTNQGNGHMSFLSNRQGSYGIDYVDTVTLDNILANEKEILLIKIDVEGYEAAVLDGARRLITSRKVRYIVMEFSPETRTNAVCDATKMVATMLAAGYRASDVIMGSETLQSGSLESWPPNVLFTLLQNP